MVWEYISELDWLDGEVHDYLPVRPGWKETLYVAGTGFLPYLRFRDMPEGWLDGY